MGILKLTFLTVGAMGAAMLHFGRDVDLPADRLGMEPGIEQSTIEPVSASVKQPILVVSQPVKVIKAVAHATPVTTATRVSAPDPNSQAGRAVAAAKQMAASAKLTPVSVPATSLDFPTMYVQASAVNMRSGPSTQNGVIGRLTRGMEVVNMGDAAPGWSQIRVVSTGQRGFMASKFLAAQK